jgi:hypothetical protein
MSQDIGSDELSGYPLSGATLVPNSLTPAPTSQASRKSRIIMDSDDEMEDEIIARDEDDFLNMPSGSQSLEMNFGRDFANTTSDSSRPTRPGTSSTTSNNQDTRIPTNLAPLGSNASAQGQKNPLTSAQDNDDLFGDDFFAQFGDDGELEFEENQNKKPLFSRRIPLLEASDDSPHGPDNDDLGLEMLSISQTHRTKSGAPPITEMTRSSHTVSSSTTITSSIPSRISSFGRSSTSAGQGSFKSLAQSQHEEELYEMSARQQDAVLEDMIREDEMLRDEEAGLQDLLDAQFYEQEMMLKQQFQTSDTNKRKGPGAVPTTFTDTNDTSQTLAEYDQFLEESALINNSALENALEASKRSRLQRPAPSSKSGLSTKAKGPEVKKYDYTLPPATGSFIKARSSSGTTFYLAKKVRTDQSKVILRLFFLSLKNDYP